MEGVTDVPRPRAVPGVAPASTLNTGLDAFRGLTILAVVLHHASGLALAQAQAGSTTALLLGLLNRTLHFVVPAFLMLSAALLTASLLRRPDLGRYFRRRVLRGVWPYLLWTGLYALWYVWRGDRPASDLADPARWLFYLEYGKASFHLYFLLVALELYLILPLLLPLARRRPTIGWALALGFAAQVVVYALNAAFFHFRFPASTVVWYLAPIVLGVAVGARLETFAAWWARRWGWVMAGLALATALYIPQAVTYIDGGAVIAWTYSLGNWAYTTLASLTVLALSLSLARARPRLAAPFAALGGLSLQVYLIHPALLQLLDDRGFPGQTWAFLGVFALYTLVAALLPWLLARAIQGTRVSDFLFGRS